MSASTHTKPLHTFLVFAPDRTDEGTLERRQKVLAQHRDTAIAWYESGFMKMGGALLSEPVESPDSPLKMTGSMLVARAESIDEVRRKVEADVLWTEGVWDKERLVITHFIQAPFTE